MVLGLHQADFDNHELANTYLRRVLEIDPETARSISAQFVSMATAQSKRGFLPKAIRTTEQALAFAILTGDHEAARVAGASLTRLRDTDG